MIGITALILLFLNYVVFYNDISIDLRENHSRTFIRKHSKGLFNKLLFIPFIREINKVKYSLMLLNYILSLIGMVLQIFLLLNLITDNSLVVICFIKFMVIYCLTLFIYKLVLNRIFIAIGQSNSFIILIILFAILVYAIIFIIVPIYQNFITTA